VPFFGIIPLFILNFHYRYNISFTQNLHTSLHPSNCAYNYVLPLSLSLRHVFTHSYYLFSLPLISTRDYSLRHTFTSLVHCRIYPCLFIFLLRFPKIDLCYFLTTRALISVCCANQITISSPYYGQAVPHSH